MSRLRTETISNCVKDKHYIMGVAKSECMTMRIVLSWRRNCKTKHTPGTIKIVNIK